MKTTAIIVDILIIGFFALCWIFLLIIKFTPFDLNSINCIMKEIQAWATPITFGLIFVCYQLGLMINWLGAFIVSILIQKKCRDNKIFKKEKYDKVKAIIDQYGSPELHKYLGDDLVIIRSVRSGVINFLLICIFSIFLHYWLISIISFVFMIVCIFYFIQRYPVYYYRILNVYKVILKNEIGHKLKKI